MSILPKYVANARSSALLSCILAVTVGYPTVSSADDTEIFFGQSNRQPNVLFVLDVSGSMDESAGTDGSTRLSQLKSALDMLLSTTNDINAGLMQFASHGSSHFPGDAQLVQEIQPISENRAAMISSVNGLLAGGGTPTIGALLGGTQYFRGNWSNQGSNTTFPSPMQSVCQTNHIVLLTDGEPGKEAISDAESLIYGDDEEASCVDAVREAGTCGAELANWIATTDQSEPLTGNNGIITHTIGFNFSDDWLPTVTTGIEGAGHYTANNASELLSAFDQILESVENEDFTFAAPAVSIDKSTRLSHREDIYLSLFQPSSTMRWLGNLKRYKFDGVIRDSNNNPALDTATGAISTTARSFWLADEDPDDGANLTMGGAASKINSVNRPVYTYTGGTVALEDFVNSVHENNFDITAGMLNVPAADRDNLLKWARGVDVDNEYPGSDTRLQMGDPLHSRPTLLTYSVDPDNPQSVVFLGTNEGYLHAIDYSNGKEVFAFVPPELLENLDMFYQNERTVNRRYGIDGDLTLWVKDDNRDGDFSDTDEHAYLYMGMRRGGRNYTALDVSTKDKPTYKWSINGGEGDFATLGQTWSKPTLGKIAINGVATDVLIFGGGYDPTQDHATIRSSDTMGNDIFIINAEDKSLLWRASNDDTTAFDAMEFSIPSDPAVVDINGDGLADQIYVGDMGGQIWRLDINNQSTSATPSVKGGVIANVSGTDAADNRRLFYKPDVALVRGENKQFLSIAIGSGNRAHPLDTSVQDQFYMIRQHAIFSPPEGYGVIDEDESDDEVTVYRPIDERDLYDATANDIGSTDIEIADQAMLALQSEQGWRIELDTGEKVLASSITLDGQLKFNTYLPVRTAHDDCSPNTGSGRAYTVSVLDATPTSGTTADDRHSPLLNPGIPPEPVPHINEDGELNTLNGIDDGEAPTVELTRRVFWTEQPDF